MHTNKLYFYYDFKNFLHFFTAQEMSENVVEKHVEKRRSHRCRIQFGDIHVASVVDTAYGASRSGSRGAAGTPGVEWESVAPTPSHPPGCSEESGRGVVQGTNPPPPPSVALG